MGQKIIYILVAIIISAAVLTGAFLLMKRVFPNQIERLPIVGMVGRSTTPTPTPLAELENKQSFSTNKETGDATTRQTPSPSPSPSSSPSSLANAPVESSSPSPTPTPTSASSKSQTSSNLNTTTTYKTIYVVQPSPTSAAFKVTNLTINSSPANYAGSCPKDVTIYATITTNGAGTVNYRWVRSDGTEAGENSISFDFASSKSVENTWSRSSSGWEKLKITSPNSLESSQATFSISCN